MCGCDWSELCHREENESVGMVEAWYILLSMLGLVEGFHGWIA